MNLQVEKVAAPHLGTTTSEDLEGDGRIEVADPRVEVDCWPGMGLLGPLVGVGGCWGVS